MVSLWTLRWYVVDAFVFSFRNASPSSESILVAIVACANV